MKKVKFATSLVPLVLSGEKTSTWRLFDDKDLSVGDDIICVDTTTGAEFASARITSVKEKPLGDVVDGDFVAHEKFESREKMFETYRIYYGDKVQDDSVVKIINFMLLEQ